MCLLRYNNMELDERSIIIDDHLNRIAEAGMERYFTHAYCTAGECGLTYNGERFTIAKGDCVPNVYCLVPL